jgi:hypothetical protein
MIFQDHDAAKIKELWDSYREADGERTKRGLEFGKALYELREKYRVPRASHVGDTRGGGFEAVIQRLNIPNATAYRWINRYEESIGERTPREPESEPDNEFEPMETGPRDGGVAGQSTSEPAEPDPENRRDDSGDDSFHILIASSRLMRWVRRELEHWPLEAQGRIPQLLRRLADELEREIPC